MENQFAKVPIKCEDDSLFATSLVQNRDVFAAPGLLDHPHHIMSLRAQPLHQRRIEVLVCNNSHQAESSRNTTSSVESDLDAYSNAARMSSILM